MTTIKQGVYIANTLMNVEATKEQETALRIFQFVNIVEWEVVFGIQMKILKFRNKNKYKIILNLKVQYS